MAGIKGIGGIPEPAPDRSASVRDKKRDETVKSAQSQDDVLISSEAQAAAKLAQLLQVARQQTDVRAERVAAAKAAIERGDYKKPEVVQEVARRIQDLLG
ncbi:MAG: flagellar biosynthesis anti-sigma factor FlgM [Candidatus Hydrogenedentes bacterium]|nr:flagellar biosynthesis anti-sigma factor FlgM [Candidatus Hydrogenedentota bacterium]